MNETEPEMKYPIQLLSTLLFALMLTLGFTACGDADSELDSENVEDTTYVGYQTTATVSPDSAVIDSSGFEDTKPNDMKPVDYDQDDAIE